MQPQGSSVVLELVPSSKQRRFFFTHQVCLTHFPQGSLDRPAALEALRPPHAVVLVDGRVQPLQRHPLGSAWRELGRRVQQRQLHRRRLAVRGQPVAPRARQRLVLDEVRLVLGVLVHRPLLALPRRREELLARVGRDHGDGHAKCVAPERCVRR